MGTIKTNPHQHIVCVVIWSCRGEILNSDNKGGITTATSAILKGVIDANHIKGCIV